MNTKIKVLTKEEDLMDQEEDLIGKEGDLIVKEGDLMDKHIIIRTIKKNIKIIINGKTKAIDSLIIKIK